MNTPARPPCLRFAPSVAPLLLAVVFLASPALHAQGNAADAAASKAAQATTREAFANARSLAKAGNIDAAEAALEKNNLATPGTSLWYRANAQSLLQLHVQLREEGRLELLPAIASRALQKLDTAARIAAKPADQAAAIHLAGFICERLTRDLPAALKNYETAAALRPTSASAKDDIARVKRAIAASQRRNA